MIMRQSSGMVRNKKGRIGLERAIKLSQDLFSSVLASSAHRENAIRGSQSIRAMKIP